jgi:short-subunit dehydrogenase
MRIAGRTVLVTGASSGIGDAASLAFARAGAGAIALVARNRDALDRVAAQARALGATARAYPVDLADLRAAETAADQVVQELGVPDVIVNNAGSGRWLFTEDTSPDEATAMMAVPYLGAFALTRALLPGMLARRSGCVVNVTSPAAFCPWPGTTAYAVARWAMRGFTEALRADLHRTGLHVALVAPGEVRSPYFEHNPGTRERLPRIATSLYRALEVEEVARMILRAVERERRLVVAPGLLRLTLAFHRIFPRPVEWLVAATGVHRPPSDREPSR